MRDVIYRYTGPGRYYGIPARDLTQADYDALAPEHRAIVRTSAVYAEAKGADEIADPLRHLDNAQYAELAPAEKAARTRAAKKDGGES